MVKDIIISRKVGTHHYSRLFIAREDTEETESELRYKYIIKYFNENDVNIPNIDQIMSIIQSLTLENVDSYYPVLNYLDLYVDVFERLDLIDASGLQGELPVLVYLNSPNNGAVAIASEDNESSSFSDCVMNLFIHKLTMDPAISGIVSLDVELDTYNSLANVSAGYDYDASKFYNFITSGGKEIKIFIA